MHVLHITLPVEFACGTSRHVWTLSREQAKRHRVMVVTSGGGALAALNRDGVESFILPIDPRHKTPWGTAVAIIRLATFARRERVTVLHAHHRWHALLARVVAELCGGIPVVATCHSMSLGHRWLTYPVDRIIAVSEATRRLLEGEFGIPARKITVIRTVSFPEVRSGERLHPALECNGERPVILGVGRLSPEKGFATFLTALALLRKRDPKPLGVLVGDGPVRPTLEMQAADLGIEVLFTGAVRNPWPYLRRATMLVQPSLEDAAPLTVLEAGVAGRPVIASALVGIAEMIRNEETGLLVPPNDAPALARAIDRLLDDEHLRHRLGETLQRVVVGRLDPAPMVDDIERVYVAAHAR